MLLLAVIWLRIPLPVLPMVAITITLGAFNLFHSGGSSRRAGHRRRSLRAAAGDVAALGGLLYFAGGSANLRLTLPRAADDRGRGPAGTAGMVDGRRHAARLLLPDVLEPAAAAATG